MSIVDNARSEIATVEAAGKSFWSRIKPLLITAVISALVSGIFTKCAFGSEPLVSPAQAQILGRNFTAPQEQASALAVPPVAAPEPVNVVVIVLCNDVVGLFVTDVMGELHMFPFKTKEDVTTVQKFVDGAHNKSINLGCPGIPAKDTTVL